MKLIVNFSSFSFQRHRRTTYIWYHLLPTLLTLSNYVNSQCFGGVETYEKTSGMYYCIGFLSMFQKIREIFSCLFTFLVYFLFFRHNSDVRNSILQSQGSTDTT